MLPSPPNVSLGRSENRYKSYKRNPPTNSPHQNPPKHLANTSLGSKLMSPPSPKRYKKSIVSIAPYGFSNTMNLLISPNSTQVDCTTMGVQQWDQETLVLTVNLTPSSRKWWNCDIEKHERDLLEIVKDRIVESVFSKPQGLLSDADEKRARGEKKGTGGKKKPKRGKEKAKKEERGVASGAGDKPVLIRSDHMQLQYMVKTVEKTGMNQVLVYGKEKSGYEEMPKASKNLIVWAYPIGGKILDDTEGGFKLNPF